MRRSSISGVSEAGPIVATILVLLLGSGITAQQCPAAACGRPVFFFAQSITNLT
jgi:hypothetical protein